MNYSPRDVHNILKHHRDALLASVPEDQRSIASSLNAARDRIYEAYLDRQEAEAAAKEKAKAEKEDSLPHNIKISSEVRIKK